MKEKSSEFTGDLFTKSESKTEDLIVMMTEVQDKYIQKFSDDLGKTGCFERKVLSGDNKTEKNSFYGILRYRSSVHSFSPRNNIIIKAFLKHVEYY